MKTLYRRVWPDGRIRFEGNHYRATQARPMARVAIPASGPTEPAFVLVEPTQAELHRQVQQINIQCARVESDPIIHAVLSEIASVEDFVEWMGCEPNTPSLWDAARPARAVETYTDS